MPALALLPAFVAAAVAVAVAVAGWRRAESSERMLEMSEA